MPAAELTTFLRIWRGLAQFVGEATACGVPVVSTDVGDASEIVGPTGIIVASRDASALTAAWERFYGLDATVRREPGVSARQQIVGRYALTAVRGTLRGALPRTGGGGGRA